MSDQGGGGRARRRPWWLLAVAYAVAVVSYVAVTLPGRGAGPAGGVDSTDHRPSPDKVELVAVGDIGSDADAELLLKGVGRDDPDFFLPLGGLSYAGPGSEVSWCNMVRRALGGKVPVQLVAGDHEDDTGADGSITEFARCLPDRKQAVGSYPAQYYFDVGTLLRTVVISPDLEIGGHQHVYTGGSEDERWLRSVLDDARRHKISWITVAMHKACISIGRHGCEIRPDLLNLLVDYRVDLVLQGHDHTYQRTVQLAHSPLCRAVPVDESFRAECVADDGGDGKYRAGDGTVLVVVGSANGQLHPLDDADPDQPYVAKAMGANRLPTRGFLGLEVRAGSLTGRFVQTAGSGDFRDRFEISR